MPDGGVRVILELGTDGRLHETPVAPALQISVPAVVELERSVSWWSIAPLSAGIAAGYLLPVAVLVPVLVALLAFGAAVWRYARDPVPEARVRR